MIVDGQLRASVAHIFAPGDVNGLSMPFHSAVRMSEAAAAAILDGDGDSFTAGCRTSSPGPAVRPGPGPDRAGRRPFSRWRVPARRDLWPWSGASRGGILGVEEVPKVWLGGSLRALTGRRGRAGRLAGRRRRPQRADPPRRRCLLHAVLQAALVIAERPHTAR